MASLAWNPTPPDWQTPPDPRTRTGTSPYYTGYETVEQLQPLLPAAQQINQGNLAYLTGGIPNYAALTQTESGNIANLLHPTDFTDVQRQAAEKAVAGGFAGSGVADQLGLRMTEDEKIRREVLGSQLLSGAAGRLPAPFNPASLLGRGSIPTAPAGPGVAYRGGPAGGGGAPAPSPLTPGGPPPNPPGAPGTAPPQNWLADIINRYSPGAPSTPAWQMSSGLGPGFANGAPGDLGVDEFGIPIGPYDQQEYDLTPTPPTQEAPAFTEESDYYG